MASCTAVCTADIVIPSLAQVCATMTRNERPSKLLILTCSTAIPTGIPSAKATALAALLASGDLGATGRLSQFLFADPQTTDISYDDCSPATPVVTQRDLTFSDFNAIDVDDDGTTPLPYADRAFWRTVKAAGQKFIFGWTTCDGLLYWFTIDAAYTNPITAILQIFTSYDTTVANKSVEVKKGTIRFLGDPFDEFPEPYLDLNAVVGAQPTLKALW